MSADSLYGPSSALEHGPESGSIADGWRFPPEWFYLYVAIPLGLAMLFLTPPIQSPDEDFHFFRAYQVSDGQVIALKKGDETGGYLPSSLVRFVGRFDRLPFFSDQKISRAEILDSASIPLDQEERQFLGFSAIAVQPPLGHLPQALGLLLARQFTSSVLICLYVGRCFNLFATIVVLFLAIRRTPICRWGMTALALTPMSMFLTASLSSDALTNALAFLFLAEIFRCAFGSDTRVATSSVLLLAMLGATVGGLVKQAYFPLAICFLLIPRTRLSSTRRYVAGFAIVMGATLLGTAAWGFVVRDIYSPARLTQGIDPKEQLRLVLSEPGDFFMTLFWSVYYQWRTKLKEYLGILGWLDFSLPSNARNLEWISLIVIVLADFRPRFRLNVRQLLLAVSTASAISLLVMLLLHLTWNPVGFPYARFQGRYLIPIGPLLGIAFAQLVRVLPSLANRTLTRLHPIAVAYVPCFLIVALWCVYDRYYVDTPDTIVDRSVNSAIHRLQDGETLDDVRAGLQESLQIASQGKHFERKRMFLTSLLESRDSRDVVRRIGSDQLKRPKDIAEVCITLGTIHTADGDYADAIACFEKSNSLKPGNEMTAFLLWGVRNLSQKLSSANQSVMEQVRDDMIERRPVMTNQEEWHLKPCRGPVGADFTGTILGSPQFVWRCQPPSGQTICIRSAGEVPGKDGRPAPFYACSATPCLLDASPTMDKPFPRTNGKRIFVFPPPLNAVLLNDEQISWYFQRRMIDLSQTEIERELAYREELQISFPLATLPDSPHEFGELTRLTHNASEAKGDVTPPRTHH